MSRSTRPRHRTLHDISRPIHTGMPVWPGDTSADFKLVATIPRGSAVNIGRLLMSVHSGTHGDAPYHYNQVGARIDEVPIDTFVGPAPGRRRARPPPLPPSPPSRPTFSPTPPNTRATTSAPGHGPDSRPH